MPMTSESRVSVLCLALAVGASEVGIGCQCSRLTDPVEARRLAEAVFAGTVVARSVENLPMGFGSDKQPVEVTTFRFKVAEVWKGEVGSTISIVFVSASVCHFEFEVGRKYLVFAVPVDPNPEFMAADRCLPTTSYERSRGLRKKLGASKRPAESGASAHHHCSHSGRCTYNVCTGSPRANGRGGPRGLENWLPTAVGLRPTDGVS